MDGVCWIMLSNQPTEVMWQNRHISQNHALIKILSKLYNRNDSHLDMSDLHSWLNGQSVALEQREIASSDPNGVLLL